MSVSSDFKFGPWNRPAVDTSLKLLQLPRKHKVILDTLAPRLSQDLIEQIQGIFSKSLSVDSGKRQKVERSASYENGVKMLGRQQKVVAGCNPAFDENDPKILARAEARAFERLFFDLPTSKCLKPTQDLFQAMASFLDVKELGRLAVCSPEANYDVSNLHSRVWRDLATNTFPPLDPKIYWTEYSKQKVKENFLHLGRMQEIYRTCCNHEATRKKMLAMAGMNELPPVLSANGVTDPRQVFKKEILKVVPEIDPDRDFEDVLYEISGELHSPLPAFSVYELFFTCGIKGGMFTIHELCKDFAYELFRNRGNHSVADIERGALRALTLAVNHADISGEYIDWIFTETLLVKRYLIPLALRLIERGGKCGREAVDLVIQAGALELLEPMITKAGAKVLLERIHKHIKDLAFSKYSSDSGAQVFAAIELLLKHATDSYGEVEWAFPGDDHGEFELEEEGLPASAPEIFRKMASYCHDGLMQKLIDQGYRPDNSDSDQNTLCKVLKEGPSHKNFDSFPQVVETLFKHGATINCDSATEVITSVYEGDEMFDKLMGLLLKFDK